MPTHDVIVVGLGAVGGWACQILARRGANVIGFDRFSPPHTLGSSHGQSRLIREAYFEHPDYVPLVRRAYELWRELEGEVGQPLLHNCGLIEIGPADGVVVPGVLRSAQDHGIAVERIEGRDADRRFPGLSVQQRYDAVFEPSAGWLAVEDCLSASLGHAIRFGAQVLMDEPVLDWRKDGNEYVVTTARQTSRARAMIVAGGAWSSSILHQLRAPLTLLRKTLHWFHTDDERYLASNGFPAFLVERNDRRIFYGFPKTSELGLKTAEHTGGDVVDDPNIVDRSEHLSDSLDLRRFLSQWLPGISSQQTAFSTCLYTMSCDADFILDRHPAHDRLFFAAGLSGHGFKFAPVLGEVLAKWALGETHDLNVDFLSMGRFEGMRPTSGQRK